MSVTTILPVSLSGPAQRKHEAFTAGHIERMVHGIDARANYRGGLDSAAHLCDAIATDIEAGGRGKRRAELAALVRACGDAIYVMRERVKVEDTAPTSPTPEDPHA